MEKAPKAAAVRVLCVGEGDFSFSLSLARAFGSRVDLCASSLLPPCQLSSTYSRGRENLEELRRRSCRLLHSLDASRLELLLGLGTSERAVQCEREAAGTRRRTPVPRTSGECLEESADGCSLQRGRREQREEDEERRRGSHGTGCESSSEEICDKAVRDTGGDCPLLGGRPHHIIFNHPHLGVNECGDEFAHARRHYVLLCHFLHSAEKILERHPHASIRLLLCGNQHHTWRLAEAAARAGLIVAAAHNPAATPQLWELDATTACVGRAAMDLTLASTDASSQRPLLPFKSYWTDDEPRPRMLAPIGPIEPGWAARRKYRTGALGSKHFLGRYGYEHRRCEGDAPMDVGASVEYVLVRSAHDGARTPHPPDGQFCCPVCHLRFDSQEALLAHEEAPARPDDTSRAFVCVETQRAFKSKHALETYRRQRLAAEVARGDRAAGAGSDSGSSTSGDAVDGLVLVPRAAAAVQPERSKAAASLVSSGVTFQMIGDADAGSRLVRWLRRSGSLGSKTRSKSEADELLRAGRVVVDGRLCRSSADGAHVLRLGERVELLENSEGGTERRSAKTTLELAMSAACPSPNGELARDASAEPLFLAAQPSASKVVTVHHCNAHALVAWKPRKVRAACVLEGALLSTLSPLLPAMHSGGTGRYRSSGTRPRVDTHQLAVSRVDIGCEGLCVVARTETGLELLQELEAQGQIFHTMTVLVHGRAPAAWCDGGASIELSAQAPLWAERRRFSRPDVAEDGAALSSRGRVQPLGEDVEDMATFEAGAPCKKEAARVAVRVVCSATLSSRTATECLHMSTLEVRSSARRGRLGAPLCHALRALGMPVAGDHYAKREMRGLPRVVRDGIKNRISMGVYAVQVPAVVPHLPRMAVELPVPEWLLATHWARRTEMARSIHGRPSVGVGGEEHCEIRTPP